MWRVEVVVVEARFFSSLLHGYRSWILLILRRREDLQDSVPFAPWLRLDYRFPDSRTNGLSSFLIRDLIEIGRNYQGLLIEVFIWFIMNLDWWFDGWLTSFESSISRTVQGPTKTYKDLQPTELHWNLKGSEFAYLWSTYSIHGSISPGNNGKYLLSIVPINPSRDQSIQSSPSNPGHRISLSLGPPYWTLDLRLWVTLWPTN